MEKMKKCATSLAAFLLACMMVVTMLPANIVEASTETNKKATVATEKTEEVDSDKSASKKTGAKKTSGVKNNDAKTAIEEGIFQNRNETTVDLSAYNLKEKEAQSLTADVLEENNASTLVNTTYETDKKGTVTTMSVDMDSSLAYAMDEVEAIADDSGESDDTDMQMQVIAHYAELQTLYSNNPDFFGVACPYFISKDTENGPITALLSLMQQQWPKEGETLESPELSMVDQIVTGYTNTLQLCVAYLGEDLMNARTKAMATIDDSMTAIDKMLVLNDWLGNWCTFDMSSIQDMNQQQNSGSETAAMEEALDTANETADLAEDEQPSEEQIRYMLLKGDLASFVESTAFGALVRRNCLCIGYTAAYNYLVQCAFDDVYRHEKDGSWKSKEEVNEGKVVKVDADGTPVKEQVKNSEGEPVQDALNQDVYQYVYETTGEMDADGNPIYKTVDPTYMVDFVKIFWNSDVKMLGENQTFRNSHYFSAVNLGDQAKWYYIDSCYNDIYIECMGRNRVETDGNLVHSYFLVSHDTLENQFDGNYDKIETLYADTANDDTYEDAWFSKATGPIMYDSDNWYYVQNTSTYDFSGSNLNYTEGSDQLVSRPRAEEPTASNETILVDYEDSSKGKAASGKELVIDGAKADEVSSEDYAGLTHTAAKYGNAIYLNVDNKILKYDLNSNAITKVKEYNKVSVVQDKDNPFVGMSYTVVPEGTDGIVKTVTDKPLAAIAIKDDGKLYASIATNYAYVSDYAVEETNYNSEYMNYNFGGQQINRGGDNDNEEFMWSANFVEILDMAHLTGDNHTYKEVVVEPTCTEGGYTEQRCTTCGISTGEKTEPTEAAGHHYLSYKDTTYTKDDSGNRKIVDAIVCTRCLDSKDKLGEGETGEHVYSEPKYDWAENHRNCKATFTCAACNGTELDCTKDDKTIVQTIDCKVTYDEKADCATGGKAVYTASCTFKDKEYKDTKEITIEANSEHVYGEPEFVWTEMEGEGGYTCQAKFICNNCQSEEVVDCTVEAPVVTAPTCTEEGYTTYKASCTFKEESYSDEKQVNKTEALGHEYGDPEFIWTEKEEEDGYTCQATFKCTRCEDIQTVDCEITSESVGNVCTEGGSIVYTATCTFEEKTYTDKKTVEVSQPQGHTYTNPVFEWAEDSSSCNAIFKCKYGDDVKTVKCDIDKQETPADCDKTGVITYTAVCVFEADGKTYKDTVEKEIPALGHEYGEPTFNWSNDDKTCEAVFICKRDACKDEQKVSCTVKTNVKEAATCVKEGIDTYTATCTFNGKEYTDYKEKKIPFASHQYSGPTFTWSNDSTLCNAEFICNICKEKYTEKCSVTSKTTEATYTASGNVIYTATCKFNNKDYTATKTVAIPKLDAKAALNKAAYSLYATETVTASITSNYKEDAITSVKSSNTKILAVSNDGRMKGIKAGKATVTVTTKSGTTLKAAVTVKTPKVTLTAASAPLQLKKSTTAITVKSKIATDKVAKWTTSNKKIATVSKSGKITAKKPGTAKITVIMKSGAKASCKVKVQKTAVKLTKLSVNKSKVTLKLKGGAKTFKVLTAKTPVTATNKVTFKTSNKKVATVSSAGKITAKKAGTATITVKCGNKTRKIKVTVKKK